MKILKQKGPYRVFFESKGLVQLVDFYTTESGTTLDHVYVSDPLKICVQRIPFYFSYHEGIEIHLKNK